MGDTSKTTAWQPIAEVQGEAANIMAAMRWPYLGEFVGKVVIMSDDSWLIVQFANGMSGREGPENFMIIPGPPR